MLIEEIKVLNFGPFYREHVLAFPGDGSGVHLVRGGTGRGKTSINRAVLWGLYGRVTDRKGQPIKPTSLLNWTAFKEDAFQFGVELRFNEDGAKWTLRRETRGRSHSERAYELGMKIQLLRNGEEQENPEHAIRRILPSDVSRFFFFDGEMLRDYEELLDQTSRSMGLLRDSIEHVLGIPYLRIARNDLSEVQHRFEVDRNRIMRKLGGASYEKLVKEYQDVTGQLQTREAEIKKIDEQVTALEIEIADLKREQVNVASVKTLAEQRVSLDKDIALLEESRSREAARLKEILSQLYKTVLVHGADDIIARLEKKHQDTMTKYNEKQQLIGQESQLQKGLTSQTCRLCGTVLNPQKQAELNEELARVRVRIKSLTEVPEPNLEFDEHVNRLRQTRGQQVTPAKIRDVDTRVLELESKLSTLRAQRADLVHKLSEVDEELPRRIELEISRKTEEKGRLQGVKEGLERDQLDDLSVKAELDQTINSIDEAELSVLKRRIDLVEPLSEVFENAISVYRDERRSFVGKVASSTFREIRTKETFERLDINPQFGLNIITKSGSVIDRAEWRSAGEEQVVALSLIAALNQCAHVKAPVFMDTPFGRLDTEHSRRIMSFLPKLAQQVVLFVTDREFTKFDESVLAGHIRTDRTLVYSSEAEGSHIEETIGGGP